MNAWLRRALHAATASILFLVPIVTWLQFRLIVWLVAILVLLVDGLRLTTPLFRDMLTRLFPIFRPHEVHRPSGGSWLWVGYAAAVLLPPRAAIAGILVAAFADPVAATVGRRFGSPLRKSWQGTLAALVVGIGALLVVRFPWSVAFAGAAAGALLERWSGPLDDNLLVAPGVAGVVTILM